MLLAVALALTIVAVPAPAGGNPLDPKAGAFLDTDLDSLSRHALRAYQQGNYLEAARRYLDRLGRDITNAREIYNLACCFGLLGEPELAGRYLTRAFRAGFRNIEHVRRDPDFDLVADKMVFRRVVDSLARTAEARERALGDRLLIAARNYYACRVRLPLQYDPQKRYPLVVGLHGYGSDHESFVRLWERFGADPQFIFACPQAPYLLDFEDTGLSWTTAADSATAPSVRAAAEEYILDIVRVLSVRYKVTDVFLLGFSQGAGMAYSTAIRHPRHFRGIICFGGMLDTSRVRPGTLEAGKTLRVFIAHGRDDAVVGYDQGIRARELLTRYGYVVTFFDFAGGHTVTPEAARKAAEWLRAPRSRVP